ncbi:MAG: beta-ketoacyl synthase N-terminal-like domain-containing protein [Dehalococcoidia bacterium]
MSVRRVVITGRGVCSPLGCDWPSFDAAVRAGSEASLAPFPGTDVLCYQLSDDVLAKRSGRGEEPLGALATVCARQALSDARIEAGDELLDDVGLVMNTALGTSGAIESYLERLRERGPRAARPAQFVDTLLSMPASRVGIALGLRGNTAVLGGSSAFELAFDWVRHGHSPVVVAGGAEYLSPKSLRYYDRLIERSGAPRAKLAQAAAFGVLEDADHAERRGARPLAEVLGSGGASEGQEVSVPWGCDPEGRAQAAAVREALEDASIAGAELGAIVLASGDDVAEQAELTALRSILGDPIVSMRLLRPKRRMGEPLAASAGLALLVTIAALEGSGSIALVNSFEMGGGVSSLVVRVS